jgi:hypothetical protein
LIKENLIIYSPNQLYQLGKHEVTLTIKDNEGLSDFKSFNLIVYQLPSFNESIPKFIEIKASNPFIYNMPININAADYYVNHTKILPRYARYSFPSYQFMPD